MRKSFSRVAFTLACLTTAGAALADPPKKPIPRSVGPVTGAPEVIFNNSSLKIANGGWSAKSHASDSYVEYSKMLGGQMAPFDYYYQLKIVPQISLSFKGCNSLSAPAMLERIAGKTKNSLLIVKIGVGYRFAADNTASIFQNKDVPILLVGNNNDNNHPKNGCFFQITNETVLPLFRYGGASNYEDFLIGVTVERGTAVQYNIVKRVKETFALFNAAYSWTDLTGARTTAFAAAAQQFEDAINGAGEQLQRYNEELALRPHGRNPDRFVFTAPEFISQSAGTLVLYPRLIASILVDTKAATAGDVLSPEAILGSRGLSTRRCSSEILSSGTCNLKVETLHQSLLGYLAASSPAVFDLNTDAGIAKVYDTCQRVRYWTTDVLELSTLDSLAVRWAVASSSGLDKILADDKLSEPIVAATKIDRTKLQDMCWSAKDDAKFKSFVTAMNRKLP